MIIKFDDRAHWIWLDNDPRDKNGYACFRRRFTVSNRNVQTAQLRITADSRYDAYLNGHWIGHGPVRSWPSPWPVDIYNVSHLLRPGDNVLSVLVHHFGISTFQYLHDEAGLLAQLSYEDDSRQLDVATDHTWRCTPHEGYGWPVPRISCQQGWEEQFDARVAPGAPDQWTRSDFEDSSWQAARELRPANSGSENAFEPRDIPLLTRQALEPVTVRSIDVVTTAPYQFFLNPRDFINHVDRSANHIRARVLLATFIHSWKGQRIQLHPPHDRPNVSWKLNGKELKFSDRTLQPTGTGVATTKLNAGWNVLMARLPQMEHYTWAPINIWTKDPIRFSTVMSDLASETPNEGWLCLGPFAGAPAEHPFDRILVDPLEIDPLSTAEQYEEIWKRGILTPEDLAQPFVRPMLPHMVATDDVYAKGASERVVPGIEPRVTNPRALLSDNAEWTIIEPSDRGDVRFLLDFGNETIGNHEFEIDAPAGTILDFHNFEFIQRDGRINLCEGMNNSLRYVCRDGFQRYRTFLRRGFRYSWMSLRRFDRPVRIRCVRVIQSTYPIGPAGSFECSDEMLNDIWAAGVHSVRCCAEDTFTDCPTYEQTLWVGDARNEALVHLVADGDPRLSARSLRVTGRSLDRSPIVESQVPSGWQNLLPTWSFLWMRWAQEHYQLTGDEDFAREMLGYLERNNRGIASNLNEMGLFQMHAWNLFDWAGMDTPGNGIVTHINCQAAQALRQSALLAKSLGQVDLAKEWIALATAIAAAVNQHLWSENRKAYLDCIRADGSPSPVFSQQTHTAAYISGVATGVRAKRCLSIIDRPPAGFVSAGSPFFMFFLLEALVRQERFDRLIKTIREYWGQQIQAGATTFWEMYHPEAERLTRSHCHGWSAAPVVFLTQHALGIQPQKSGYREILIAPKPGDLKWAQGRVVTPRGAVDVYWKKSGSTFDLKVSAPPKIPLRIELPVRGKIKIVRGKGSVRAGAVTARSGPIELHVTGAKR